MSATATSAPPVFLEALLERFDAERFHSTARAPRIRLGVTGAGAWDAVVTGGSATLAEPSGEPDALLAADAESWQRIAGDVRGGMVAYREGRLAVRRNLHLGVGMLAATSAGDEPGGLRFSSVKTRIGEITYCEAGVGEPLLALHGLGGTKASFLPTIAALAESHRVIAVDLPGFGDSVKPIGAPYDARWFAGTVAATMDALELDTAHVVGNSMGGRIALEAGLRFPERIDRIVLLCPALAWLRNRQWAGLVRLLRPEFGLLQMAPRPVVDRIVRNLIPGTADGWAAAGVDEFLRAYLTPRGRAAFYAAARSIYLDEPGGESGFWARLRALERDCLFVWGLRDGLVPVAFRRHVEDTLPRAKHVELDCGHVPQVEAPQRTHQAMRRFLATA